MSFERVAFVQGEGANSSELSLAVGVSGEASSSELCIILLHGAGSSKATWHHKIEHLRGFFLLIAPDMRSHGESSQCKDLSLDALVGDVKTVIREFQPVIGSRKIIVIGHSVGGAIATALASQDPLIAGVVVIDLVEETALESLVHMRAVLASWPKSFPNVADCVKWSTSMRRPQSIASAEKSIPSLLKLNEDTSWYEWVTDLAQCEGDWEGWFRGFDASFLALTMPHCLLLSSADRLDSMMCAAHMQGAFELHVVQGGLGGHFVQEDNSEECLGIVVNFLMRRQLISKEVANKVILAGLSTSAMPSPYRSALPSLQR